METILATVATLIVTMGVSWMFYPAWVVKVADRIEWEVEKLSTESETMPLLSMVVPAYNEQDRIPIMIQEAYDFLISKEGARVLQQLQTLAAGDSNKIDPSTMIEWIIVNDGSNDETCRVVREAHQKMIHTKSNATTHTWKIVSLKHNSGKGAAVKTGMQLAQGHFHLMVDADGATDFGKGLERLTLALQDSSSSLLRVVAVFGSRAHLQEQASTQRSLVRTLLMKGFHIFVSLFVSTKIKDTQCGFKLFPEDVSHAIFGTLHLRRWAFDTEIVLLCEQIGIPILEVGVPWHEVDGSKLSTSKLALAIVSITMLRDMICVRTCYTFGIWKVKKMQSNARIIQK
jgi:dolichyl-phosphate beta-glucosyltransferase